MPERPPVLPDLLGPGLRLVFCGTAASRRSAELGAYYAHPGNRFWPTLAEVGLTPRRYAPEEFPHLLQLGIGLTDLAKHAAGTDAELPADAFDVQGLRERIERCAPKLLAFTSKRGAQAALGGAPDIGLQQRRFAGACVFVLPSPSGQARRWWRIQAWQELARLVSG